MDYRFVVLDEGLTWDEDYEYDSDEEAIASVRAWVIDGDWPEEGYTVGVRVVRDPCGDEEATIWEGRVRIPPKEAE